MASGNAVRRNFVGDRTHCRGCDEGIIVTEAMARYGKYTCGKCNSSRSVEWAKRNRDKKRAANAAYSSRVSDKRAKATAKYRANHPEKAAAMQAVQTAKRNGSLIPEPCVCGSRNVHAHHDDYSKPLDVEWLCHTHHMERHSMLAERAKREE